MPGPGRVGMCGALNKFLEPGDTLLMLDNGYWGRYPEVMAESYGFKMEIAAIPLAKLVAASALSSRRIFSSKAWTIYQ